jgi:hypothetical protein
VDSSALAVNTGRVDRDANLRIAHRLAFGRMSDAVVRGDDDALSAAVEDLINAC